MADGSDAGFISSAKVSKNCAISKKSRKPEKSNCAASKDQENLKRQMGQKSKIKKSYLHLDLDFLLPDSLLDLGGLQFVGQLCFGFLEDFILSFVN